MKQLLETAIHPAEELHLLESNVTLLRVTTFLRLEFRFARAKRNLQEILHCKSSRFVHLESERGRCFISYHQRETSMLTRDAMHRKNVRFQLWWAKRL